MLRSPALLVLASLLAAPALARQVDLDQLGGLQARSIGPAGMSGRVAAIAALPSDPNVIYVGAATGGLWRSRNGGLGWESLFDSQPVASIGAIAVHPAFPDVVWIGTGEGNPRNSASVGNGVYRSLDGGKSFTHLGLERSEHIRRILLDPSDPDVAWVAASGPTWGAGGERGLYLTRDGGASWQAVLEVDENTGCTDVAADPRNPRRILAAMWDHRRTPHSFRSGGPGSGLHLSLDGGKSWKRLTSAEGLPAGELGRIGIAFAPSAPNVVYALVEAEQSALLRSSDGGASWKVQNSEPDIAQRPFYFCDIRVDPNDADRVYSLESLLRVSDDGGKSFRVAAGWNAAHPDHHALWIHPGDGKLLIDGNDGGVAISYDRGATWRFVRNLPLAQYYHVAVDDERPYNIYGGLQDNGSWRGPSSVWENGGILTHHWQEVDFGDGFATLPLPGDAQRGYAMSQGGELVRYDLTTGERKAIRPDGPEDVELRFNWNAGIALDPFDPDAVYYGSQFLHRSGDRGESWTRISPDLTTANPEWLDQAASGGLTLDVTGAENYETILAIAPSTLERGTIWVGTDDGRVQLTRDGGASWRSVEEGLAGAPRNAWVPHVEASKHDPARAYVVLDDHRRNDWTTYVYVTDDGGASFQSLASPELRGWSWCIEEDPVDPDLLFLGTEFGLWVSFDRGAHWAQWKHGLPTVSTSALVVHPREHDLVIATHGRALYVIEDIRPLRHLTPERMAEPLHLFEVPAAQQYVVAQPSGSRFTGMDEFRGQSRPYGALVTYWLGIDPPAPAEAEEGEEPPKPEKVRLRIETLEGELVRELEDTPVRGLRRMVWDLRAKAFRRPGSDPLEELGFGGGPEVLPGRYRAILSYAGHEARTELEVLADPRQSIAPEARAAKLEALREVGAMQERLARAIDRLTRLQKDIDVVLVKADEAKPEDAPKDAPHPYQALIDRAKSVKKRLKEEERKLWHPPETKGIPKDDRVVSRIDEASYSLSTSPDAPTAAQRIAIERAREALDEALSELQKVLDEQVGALRLAVEEAGLRLLGALDSSS